MTELNSMTQDELQELGAIRERLRSLEDRIIRHEKDSRDRGSAQDTDIRELAKTVAGLSTTLATISVRLGSASPGLAGPIAAGTGLAGGVAAILSWAMSRYLVGG
jgi:hypothetical protein